MKIIVLKGSPNKHGSSNLLAENFIWGTVEAGHRVEIIDAAHGSPSSMYGLCPLRIGRAMCAKR